MRKVLVVIVLLLQIVGELSNIRATSPLTLFRTFHEKIHHIATLRPRDIALFLEDDDEDPDLLVGIALLHEDDLSACIEQLASYRSYFKEELEYDLENTLDEVRGMMPLLEVLRESIPDDYRIDFDGDEDDSDDEDEEEGM